jgi:hypothetical protein
MKISAEMKAKYQNAMAKGVMTKLANGESLENERKAHKRHRKSKRENGNQ